MNGAILLGELIIDELDRIGINDCSLLNKKKAVEFAGERSNPDAAVKFEYTNILELINSNEKISNLITGSTEALALPYPDNVLLIFNL